MTKGTQNAARWRAALLAAVLIAGGGGYWLGTRQATGSIAATSSADGRKVLYYYDPMFPNQKFDKPGKSPFMDMQLMPKYADDGAGSGQTRGVGVDPAMVQSLGLRSAPARVGVLPGRLVVTGTVEFNGRDVAVVQARSAGFVTRVYSRAPGDVVRAGAPIADLQVPEWAGAQTEFLAVKRIGKPDWTAAARQRLKLLGMSDGLIEAVERSGRTNGIVTITSPVSGVIQTLDARTGSTMAMGQTLATVNSIGSVWLNAAIPEAQAASVKVGASASATFMAFPGEAFVGRIVTILPAANADARTLTARIELPNRGGRLRPGMFAQVSLGGSAATALLVPSDAVIRTGTRTLVMLDTVEGRYHPAEVRTGREGGGQTEILRGLREGEKVVVSGQFLLDSEASISGIDVRKLDTAP